MLKNKLDHFEVTTNQVIGIIIGYLITRLISIPFATTVNADVLALTVTFIFFCLSYLRMFIIRKIFRKIDTTNKKEDYEN